MYPEYAFIKLRSSWHREAVLQSSFVEVGEIHAASPSSVCLWDQHGVRDPHVVLHYANELYSDQLVDFVFKRLGSFGIERSPLLSSGGDLEDQY